MYTLLYWDRGNVYTAEQLYTVYYPCLFIDIHDDFIDRTLLVSAMPVALIGLRIASVRVVFGDTMSTEHFAAHQSRVGPL